MIEIDGSVGEGGGQVLRTALCLSCLTGQDVRVNRIRAGRRKPGLAPQHLTAVRALATICRAAVGGDQLGSVEVTFRPARPPHAGRYSFDVSEAADGGSAGSVSLLAQALIPVLAFAGGRSHLTLKGGTHVRWSPPFEFLEAVYLPRLRALGIEVEGRLRAWGFYPAGGGEIELDVEGMEAGARLSPQDWSERGSLLRISGSALASSLPAHIPQRMTDRARNLLRELTVPFAVVPKRVTGAGPGAGLFLIAEYERIAAGFTAHGQPGKPSERVAEGAVERLLAFHQSAAAVDRHLGDQILLPLALATGTSIYTTPEPTGHLTTSAHLITRFLDVRIRVGSGEGGPCRVEVEGVGLAVS